MPKSKSKQRTQPRPITLYDPDGEIALAIDTLAALLEHKTSLPVGRATATMKGVKYLADVRMIDDGVSDEEIAVLVADWRQRHNLSR